MMKSGRTIDICVCVPSTGTWVSAFGKCMTRLFTHYSMSKAMKGWKAKRLRLHAIEGSMLVQMRHDMVKKAIQDGCTHILFLDSDMVFPRDTIHKLLRHDKDVVAANCTTRSFPVKTIAHDLEGNLIDSTGKHGLQEVQHVGMAVALIRTEVLKQLIPPLFMMEWIPEHQAYCGEDVYFCQKLWQAGVKIHIDHDLSREIKHVGQYAYGYKDLYWNPKAEEVNQVKQELEEENAKVHVA